MPRLKIRPVVPTLSSHRKTLEQATELDDQDKHRFQLLCNELRRVGKPTNEEILHVKALMLITLELSETERCCFRAVYFYKHVLEPLAELNSDEESSTVKLTYERIFESLSQKYGALDGWDLFGNTRSTNSVAFERAYRRGNQQVGAKLAKWRENQ